MTARAIPAGRREASHVPGEKLAKGVVLKSGDGYILAVLAASKHIAMEAVEKVTGAPVMLASEAEASMLFPDCEEGAVPVFGAAYGIPAVLDDTLDVSADIYCEGGDHRTLVHMDGKDFRAPDVRRRAGAFRRLRWVDAPGAATVFRFVPWGSRLQHKKGPL